jgi:cysteine desulfurase
MIYLDNSATTPPCEEALSAAAKAAKEAYFNPSSLYAQAMAGQKLLSGAGQAVMRALGVREGKVVMTSGGT